MTEKQFNVFDVDGTVFLEDHKEGSYHIGEKENVDIHCLNDIADRLNTYADENEQLKQQIKIFEKFLEANDLSIDWVEFCGVDECAFENPDFSCQECIHLKGDVE